MSSDKLEYENKRWQRRTNKIVDHLLLVTHPSFGSICGYYCDRTCTVYIFPGRRILGCMMWCDVRLGMCFAWFGGCFVGWLLVEMANLFMWCEVRWSWVIMRFYIFDQDTVISCLNPSIHPLITHSDWEELSTTKATARLDRSPHVTLQNRLDWSPPTTNKGSLSILWLVEWLEYEYTTACFESFAEKSRSQEDWKSK